MVGKEKEDKKTQMKYERNLAKIHVKKENDEKKANEV